MPRLTIDDLTTIKKEEARREEETRVKAIVHMGTCGIASGAGKILAALVDAVEAAGVEDVVVTTSGCLGLCSKEPLVTVAIAGRESITYHSMDEAKIRQVYERHIRGGEVQREFALVKGLVERGSLQESGIEAGIPSPGEIPFFSKQELRVLRNRGVIDPERIEAYIVRDGYRGAAKALLEITPEGIIAEVKESGLRGRGGGGFPTGQKWQFAYQAPGAVKYVLCNADEGDPGAFMDRSILEGDPHTVLEGMIIAAKAIGARQGYIYCRAEYPLAVHRLTTAIKQAREYGLLGEDIFGSGFSFDLEVYQGAGAFVCGEETALMASIEGRRGTPRPRPPFPAQQGLWRKPTILNNVETFANIPQIIVQGGAWYAGIGTEGSKGTKVFALTGDVNNVGLVEVPMGTSIGTTIFDIGGGIPNGKRFKAAQLGGPSGGCVPIQHLNTPTDYEAITQLGAIMGSGGLICMDEDACMVDVARFFMDFCQDESCGKCVPCRVGTKRMLAILTAICEGRGSAGDIELLEELAAVIKDAALCGLGQTAPNPVLSTIRYFRHEYEAHIRDKRCPASVCSSLFTSPCQNTCPIGMDVPAYIALIRANRLADAYQVLLKTNPFPGICGRVCDHQCQTKCRRSQVDEPIAIKFLKRYITDNVSRPTIKPVPVTRKERIAVVGGGPAGLTAARELVCRGYGVTVFEELPLLGGMLRYGIPANRLPREILEQEIADILGLGVELRVHTRIGRDCTFADLRQGYDAVYLAVGAHQSQRLGIAGEDLIGVYGGVEFLRQVNLGNGVEMGRTVAVIGGGNSAIDAARSALRKGAQEVMILYRRLRQDMPALPEEVAAAEAEGITVHCLVAPLEVIGAQGRVTGIRCQRMRLGAFDTSGRRRPEPVEGSEFLLSTDMIIAAIGQVPDVSFLPEAIPVASGNTIAVADADGIQTPIAGVFAGGDAVTGPATVIAAIAAGKKAAREIDAALREKNGEPPYQEPFREEIVIPQAIAEEVREQPQVGISEITGKTRTGSFAEVELGYTAEQAEQEASRCLRCDMEL
jgi:NADH-quinone oxidoreductase subunit F